MKKVYASWSTKFPRSLLAGRRDDPGNKVDVFICFQHPRQKGNFMHWQPMVCDAGWGYDMARGIVHCEKRVRCGVSYASFIVKLTGQVQLTIILRISSL